MKEKGKNYFLNLIKVISGRGSWTETGNNADDNKLTGTYEYGTTQTWSFVATICISVCKMMQKYLFAKHNNNINKGIKLIFVVVQYTVFT